MKCVEIILQDCNGNSLPQAQQLVRTKEDGYVPHKSTRYYNVVLGSNGIAMCTNLGNMVNASRKLPELYSSRNKCCGCSACKSICPASSENSQLTVRYQFLQNSNLFEFYGITGAISMLPDEEGFLYPVIDALKCVRCYKCISVCQYHDE